MVIAVRTIIHMEAKIDAWEPYSIIGDNCSEGIGIAGVMLTWETVEGQSWLMSSSKSSSKGLDVITELFSCRNEAGTKWCTIGHSFGEDKPRQSKIDWKTSQVSIDDAIFEVLDGKLVPVEEQTLDMDCEENSAATSSQAYLDKRSRGRPLKNPQQPLKTRNNSR